MDKAKNQSKSRVRVKAEHTIGVIKRVFGFQKVRYRGPAKNLHRLEVTAALANLYTVRRRVAACIGEVSMKTGNRGDRTQPALEQRLKYRRAHNGHNKTVRRFHRADNRFHV